MDALRILRLREAEETPSGDDQPNISVMFESGENSGSNLGKVILLTERAVRNDGTVPIKIIQPGWGTTGYYGAKVLERYGPGAFPKGTKMYWDHPTETEARERPERSLDVLAAELVADARYDAKGLDGPGLYAAAKVFEAYKGPVDELAAHIGTSIRAHGAARDGEAEGRRGPIIESIIPSVMNSIDFVTLPGAGGQIVSLFEAARGRHDAEPSKPIQEAQVDPKIEPTPPPAPAAQPDNTVLLEAIRAATTPILQQLQEAQQATARLQEATILRDARDIVTGTLARIPNVPDMTRVRLTETLAANPPILDGKIDTAALATRITETVQDELKYLAAAAGTGRIQNMGGGSDLGATPVTIEESQKGLESALSRLGLSEAAAKIGAAGRSN